MDSMSIYKARLNGILSMVTSMSSGKKLEAIEYWNSIASQFQTIVNSNGRNQLSAIQQQQQQDADDDDDDDDDNNNNNDHYNDNGNDQSPEIGLTSPDRRDEFSTPALDSPPASQQPTERYIASELSQQPGAFSSAIDDTSYYDESFFSPTNMMVDEMDQSTQREMDEQINSVSSSSNVAHNYLNTRDSGCSNSGSHITTTDAQIISNHHLPLTTSSRSSVLQSYLTTDTTSPCPQLIVGNETEQPFNRQSYNARAVAQVSTGYTPSGVQESQLARSLEMSNVNYPNQAPSEAEASAQLEIVHALLNNSLLQPTLSPAGRSSGHQTVQQDDQDLSQSQEIARLADSLASNVDQPNQNVFGQQLSASNGVAAQDNNVYITSNQTMAQQISTSICNILSGSHQLGLSFGNSNIISGHQLEANQEIQRIFSMANGSNYLMPSVSSPSGGVIDTNTNQVATIEAPLRYIDNPGFDPRTGKDLHTCEICGKTGFSTKGNLKRHRNAHSGEKPYQCEQCDSKFTEKKSLKIHLRKHTGEKPYKCELCDKVFAQAGILKNHMDVHDEHTRKFKCSQCPRVFRQRSQLSIHLKRHDGVKNLPCTRCDVRFLTKGDLKRHFLTHTGERPYECGQCGKRFTRQQSLNEHMNRHTGRKPHSCKYCGKTFAEMSACYKHIKTHKVEVLEPNDTPENPS